MSNPTEPTFTHVDTACAVLNIGGWRLVTDPVFDLPGKTYGFGWGTQSTKSSTPALSPLSIGPVDAVLLSHDQHADNFDQAGRAFAHEAPIVLTTKAASKRLESANEETLAYGLRPGDSYALSDNRRPDITITAMPAQHRPRWLPEFVTGPVIGFLIESDALTEGPMYITGDTLLTDAVLAESTKHRVHTLVPHVGAATFPRHTGKNAHYTMSAADAVALTTALDAARVMPIHSEGWSHFAEDTDAVRVAFTEAGLSDRLVLPRPGQAIPLT